ncbi:MAG: endo-1,4-beta-xylanase [Balneola sp.]|nr:MAG: endo-1,4-beta-xylanase [Balneola sp.]
MRIPINLFLFVLLITSMACKDSSTSPEEEVDNTPSLRNNVPYPFGAAIQTWHLNDGNYVGVMRDEFSSLTAEYEMKMSPMYNDPSAIDFSDTDEFMEFAEALDIRVHGHALIWHSATPSWIENFSGSDAEFEELIENYIKTVVGRYRGQIASWDVVNEAFEDGGSNELRNSVFRQRMGDDYVAKCFQWAREADPDVLLFYNDYGMSQNGSKLDRVMSMIDDFGERGIPIDGVGYQMHISYNWPSISQIQGATGKAVSRDLLIHYSELDIRVNPEAEQTSYTLELDNRFTDRMMEIIELYDDVPEELQFGITMWGVKDDDTWLRSFWDNQDEWPLLYNEDFTPKTAYQSILDFYSN